jgi:hypothetical protein
MKSLNKDESKAPIANTEELLTQTVAAGWSELVGVALLGIGSCLAVLGVFIGEISALFGKIK